jgi:Tfp pilus assembly protein PilX
MRINQQGYILLFVMMVMNILAGLMMAESVTMLDVGRANMTERQ